MLRNFFLAYLGYLTQLCLGGGEFDNVTQNLGGGGTGGCKFEQNFCNSERGSKSWQRSRRKRNLGKTS